MLRQLILKIRRKPKPVRDNIALVLAGSFTAVIFSFWAYNIPSRMFEAGKDKAESGPSTFSQMMSNVSEQVAAVKEAIPEIKDEEGLSETKVEESLQLEAQARSRAGTSNSSSSAATTSEKMENISTSSSSNYQASPQPIRILTTNNASSSATPANE